MVQFVTISAGVATIKQDGKPDITANKVEVLADGEKVTIYARAGFNEHTIRAPYSEVSVNAATFPDAAAVVVAINALLPSFKSGGGDGEGSLVETDPVYLADKPSIALKSEIPNVSGFYSKPAGGIPAGDLAPGVIPDVSALEDKIPKVPSAEDDDIAVFSSGCVSDSLWSLAGLLPLSETLKNILTLNVY